MNFVGFPKIARLNRDCIITEKIDGTNAQICITEDGGFLVGSRKKWITPENDNYGFARWAYENKEELLKLGVGSHFGEWWGQGIQRRYNMDKKVFSLFNVRYKWTDSRMESKNAVPYKKEHRALLQDILDLYEFADVVRCPKCSRLHGRPYICCYCKHDRTATTNTP